METVFRHFVRAVCCCVAISLMGSSVALGGDEEPVHQHSVARLWNDALLEAIRTDFARPTVHARNLYHFSGAAWDAWAAYDDTAETVLHHEYARSPRVDEAREVAISYAAYRLLSWRFLGSPGHDEAQARFDALMMELGLDPSYAGTADNSPAALGNRVARTWIVYGLSDGANEAEAYANRFYQPVNPPLVPALPGNPSLADFNRWQPLALEFFVDQAGRPIPGGSPPFLSPEWGRVMPFALAGEDLVIRQRDGAEWWVWHDPGPPPVHAGDSHDSYLATFEAVVLASAALDPADGVMLDVSPAGRGNNTLGSNDGSGYALNPVTGAPYPSQWVPAGDYFRVLAEFWADGPDSETPPGHWFTIANYVADHPALVRRFGGEGPELDPLEWDVRTYLALGGAMHDAAVSAWSVKGWYDFIRPVSAIRGLCELGQSTDPSLGSYHRRGIRLRAGQIELITTESTAPGARHAHLAGERAEHVGKIAIRAWRGPEAIDDPETDVAGVGWIRCEDWWPYQRPTFVTPPFAGYVSGHSTYSRAAAEVLTRVTGSPWFPGGLGEFHAAQNEFLVFEDGPSMDVVLQWASYYDAADESGISRIYGGIHPPADDVPGRLMGAEIGADAFRHALRYINGEVVSGAKRQPFRRDDVMERRDRQVRRHR